MRLRFETEGKTEILKTLETSPEKVGTAEGYAGREKYFDIGQSHVLSPGEGTHCYLCAH